MTPPMTMKNTRPQHEAQTIRTMHRDKSEPSDQYAFHCCLTLCPSVVSSERGEGRGRGRSECEQDVSERNALAGGNTHIHTHTHIYTHTSAVGVGPSDLHYARAVVTMTELECDTRNLQLTSQEMVHGGFVLRKCLLEVVLRLLQGLKFCAKEHGSQSHDEEYKTTGEAAEADDVLGLPYKLVEIFAVVLSRKRRRHCVPGGVRERVRVRSAGIVPGKLIRQHTTVQSETMHVSCLPYPCYYSIHRRTAV